MVYFSGFHFPKQAFCHPVGQAFRGVAFQGQPYQDVFVKSARFGSVGPEKDPYEEQATDFEQNYLMQELVHDVHFDTISIGRGDSRPGYFGIYADGIVDDHALLRFRDGQFEIQPDKGQYLSIQIEGNDFNMLEASNNDGWLRLEPGATVKLGNEFRFIVPMTISQREALARQVQDKILTLEDGYDNGFYLGRCVSGNKDVVVNTGRDGLRVSRKHAHIHRDGDRLFVDDCQSTNGIYMNGHPSIRFAPQAGDVITLAEDAFEFTIPDFNFEPTPAPVALLPAPDPMAAKTPAQVAMVAMKNIAEGETIVLGSESGTEVVKVDDTHHVDSVHLAVKVENGQLSVHDLQSDKGTFIYHKGGDVTQLTGDQWEPMEPGDHVFLGALELTVPTNTAVLRHQVNEAFARLVKDGDEFSLGTSDDATIQLVHPTQPERLKPVHITFTRQGHRLAYTGSFIQCEATYVNGRKQSSTYLQGGEPTVVSIGPPDDEKSFFQFELPHFDWAVPRRKPCG